MPVLAAVACAVTAAAPASAATAGRRHPGPQHVRDGQILYTPFSDALDDLALYTVNPDGSHARQPYPHPMECPHWSPDGRQIASCGTPTGDGTTILDVDTGRTRLLPFLAPGLFSPCYIWSPDATRLACDGSTDDSTGNGIYTVRLRDWADVRQVTSNPGGEDFPGSYSPDGRHLVFVRFPLPEQGGDGALYVVNTHGTGLRRITPDWLNVRSEGDWAPHGNELVFSARTADDLRQQLWMVRSDGRGLHVLDVAAEPPCGGVSADPTSAGCTGPSWSPTGDRIVFRRNSSAGIELVTADPDGSHVHHVADEGADAGDADWGTHPLAR